MSKEFKELMEKSLEGLPIRLNTRQTEQFEQFYLDLVETNKVMNLTAITEKNEVIRKHFADSLEIIRAVPDLAEKPYQILDLGTGAGFPGIPMAIVWPNLQLFLLDSVSKKLRFVEKEGKELDLKNIKIFHGRCEDLANDPEHREKYDICVSRAVANLSTLSEYCIPFVHKNGVFIPYKTENIDFELKNAKNALAKLGGTVRNIIRFSLPEEGDRSLAVIEKTGITPKCYPRKAGIPSKQPL